MQTLWSYAFVGVVGHTQCDPPRARVCMKENRMKLDTKAAIVLVVLVALLPLWWELLMEWLGKR